MAAGDEPATEGEQLPAGVWAELLGVPCVSVTTNFFDRGSHSLLALEKVTKIEKRICVRLHLIRIATARVPRSCRKGSILPDRDSSLGQCIRNLFSLRR